MATMATIGVVTSRLLSHASEAKQRLVELDHFFVLVMGVAMLL